MKEIYLDTRQLGPYNTSEELAFKILDKTPHCVYVFKDSNWTAAENWPEVLKKDFDGRIQSGTAVPGENQQVIRYKSRVDYKLKIDDTDVLINSEFLKFTEDMPCSQRRIKDLKARMFSLKDVVVIGSVWAHELPIIQYFVSDLLSDEYNVVVAPRHIDRVDLFRETLDYLKPGLRSQGDTFGNSNVIILDTLGELKEFYGIGSINVVCGGIDSQAYRGGHNPLESLVFLQPTLIGEDYSNHRHIVKHFKHSDFLRIADGNGVLQLTQGFKSLENLLHRRNFDKKKNDLKKKLATGAKKTEDFIDEVVCAIK